MTYEDVRDQLMRELQLKALEVRGVMSPELEEDWKIYQKINPDVKAPGPEFVEYMREMMRQAEEQGANQYSPPPAQAGPQFPKWPFAGRKPEGRNAAEALTSGIRRISGE